MKKVLLMGPSRSGKTSMRSLIFANYLPHDTNRLALTMEIERSHVKFLGNLVLNLWDCGGQYDFIDKYLTNQRDVIFSSVAVMVYVFDLAALTKTAETEADKWTNQRAFEYFGNCVEAMNKHSPDASLFCLLHKADLFPAEEREAAFLSAKQQVMAAVPESCKDMSIHFYATSIWQTSLYDAWNTVIQHMIPNRDVIAHNVQMIRKSCNAAHAAVFDRSTLLCICCESMADVLPLDITSTANRLKRLKVALQTEMGNTAFWNSIEVNTGEGIAVFTPFTANTFIVVMKPTSEDSCENTGFLKRNVEKAAAAFRSFMEKTPQLASTQNIL